MKITKICPACKYIGETDFAECPKCGLIICKYKPRIESDISKPSPVSDIANPKAESDAVKTQKTPNTTINATSSSNEVKSETNTNAVNPKPDKPKLIKCIACNNDISIYADSCPQCGQPYNKKPSSKINYAIPVAVVVVVIIAVGGFVKWNKGKVKKELALIQKQQKIVYTVDSMKYKNEFLTQLACEKACNNASDSVQSYLSDGWRIVASSPKQMPGLMAFESSVTSDGCTCIGTEYVLEKEVKVGR